MQNNTTPNNNTEEKKSSIVTVTKLVTSIVICQLAGLAGAVFTMPALGWYKNLRKPFFAPPDWIFSPVWVILFLLMGVALFLVWQKREKGEARVIFITQLFLNILWTIFFFSLKSPGLAFIELVLLWFAVLCNIVSFYKISRTAGLLLLPYILWVSFAGVLNFTIWMINEGVTLSSFLNFII